MEEGERVAVAKMIKSSINQGNVLVSVGILLFIGMAFTVQFEGELIFCIIWGIIVVFLSLFIIRAGIGCMNSDASGERDKAKNRLVQGAISLIIVLIACPLVNYLTFRSEVDGFGCGCIPSSSHPTITAVSTTTTLPNAAGGRFLLIGNHKHAFSCSIHDIHGEIFNLDGSLYKSSFYIDNKGKPLALAVGPDRFFLAYSSNAVVLDWEGYVVKNNFTTKKDYFPVKVIQAGDRFYLLLSSCLGGRPIMQIYDLEGGMVGSWNVDIDNIRYYVSIPRYAMKPNLILEADMAFKGDKLFIVWRGDTALEDNLALNVSGIIYSLDGNKIRDKFTINENTTVNYCALPDSGSSYVNPKIAAGGKYFMVMFNGKMYLYSLDSGDLVEEKPALPCAHDLVYGDGRFLAAEFNELVYYDEEGEQVGAVELGEYGGFMTSLSYGEGMFVSAIPLHASAFGGITLSFLDSEGNHVRDVVSTDICETPAGIFSDLSI